jgi:hypothetical protein
MPAIIAAMTKWTATTKEGLEFVSKLLGFNIKQGESDKDYILIDNVNRKQEQLKNTRVTFFEGVLVDGHPIPVVSPDNIFISPIELEILETTKNKCDGCGIVSHCLKEILEPFSDKLEYLCNYCITYHEHPRVNESGGYNICKDCTVFKCQHHPVKGTKTG